jgi:hypothetical protein
MADKMTVAQAIEVAKATASAVRKWGRHAAPPFTNQQLMTAIEVLVSNVDLEADSKNVAIAETKEALTKANRQLAACNARVTRLAKKPETKAE